MDWDRCESDTTRDGQNDIITIFQDQEAAIKEFEQAEGKFMVAVPLLTASSLPIEALGAGSFRCP